MANLLSCSLNQIPINLGAPIDISGPPIPKKATAKKSVSCSLAKALIIHEIPIKTEAIKSERRKPRRSIKTPQGKAVAI